MFVLCYTVVVVDMDDIDSITMAGTWKQDIVSNATYTQEPTNTKTDNDNTTNTSTQQEQVRSLPILLVGNKMDKLKMLQSSESDDGKGDDSPLEVMKILEQIARQHGFVGRYTYFM